MDGAFGASITLNPNFGRLIDALDQTPPASEIRSLLNGFESDSGYQVQLGPAGGGSYGSLNNKVIVLDGSLLPVGPNGEALATPEDINTIIDILAHELSHFVDEPADFKFWGLDPTAAAARTDFLGNEATAFVDEFVSDAQLGINMNLGPNSNGDRLQDILSNIATQDGGYNNDNFKNDAFNAARNWAAYATPQAAP